jgi:hypothetical protein
VSLVIYIAAWSEWVMVADNDKIRGEDEYMPEFTGGELPGEGGLDSHDVPLKGLEPEELGVEPLPQGASMLKKVGTGAGLAVATVIVAMYLMHQQKARIAAQADVAVNKTSLASIDLSKTPNITTPGTTKSEVSDASASAKQAAMAKNEAGTSKSAKQKGTKSEEVAKVTAPEFKMDQPKAELSPAAKSPEIKPTDASTPTATALLPKPDMLLGSAPSVVKPDSSASGETDKALAAPAAMATGEAGKSLAAPGSAALPTPSISVAGAADKSLAPPGVIDKGATDKSVAPSTSMASGEADKTLATAGGTATGDTGNALTAPSNTAVPVPTLAANTSASSTTPNAPSASTEVSPQLAAVTAQSQANEGKINELATRFTNLEGSIATLTNTLQALDKKLSGAPVVVDASGNIAPVATNSGTPARTAHRHRHHKPGLGFRQHSPQVQATRAMASQYSSTPSYVVRAVVPGRAWVEGSYGGTFSVTVGDMVPGMGVVTQVNAEHGEVLTEKGDVIKYGSDDH